MAKNIDINKSMDEIGNALINVLAYKAYSIDKLHELKNIIDEIITNSSYLLDCEIYFRTAGPNNPLLYISNIVYNLKTKSALKINNEELKWLGSVWKNFFNRNISYQEIFPKINEYRLAFRSYYPGTSSFVNQIDNVNLIKEKLIDTAASDNPPLMKIENAYHSFNEIISWMKPTYFFLLDYYYERAMKGEEKIEGGTELENTGLWNFGEKNYTYWDISFITCQALGVLEAAYLILKKKKTSKRVVTIDGKQKFLSTPEIYTIYFNKFTEIKKELSKIKH